MLRRFAVPAALFALLLSFAPANAAVHSDGTVDGPSRTAATSPGALACTALWYGPAVPDEINRLASFGIAITTTNNPADLNAVNLANYDVLVVAYTGPGSIGGANLDITAFVASGHGLFVHQPNAPGLIDYAPPGFEVNITDAYWCNFPNTPPVHLVNLVHPVTTGLTDADPSGAFDLVGSIGAGYTVLGVASICGDVALAAGTYGAGRVVFDDGNAHPLAIIPGSAAYWTNLFGWLCMHIVPTNHTTWGTLKQLYR